MFISIAYLCYATDKDLNEKECEIQMDVNPWEEIKIIPQYEKFSKQVYTCDIEDCYATDKDLNEKECEIQMDVNAWKKVKIIPEKFSKQVYTYDIEDVEDDYDGIFLENIESCTSPSNKIKLYKTICEIPFKIGSPQNQNHTEAGIKNKIFPEEQIEHQFPHPISYPTVIVVGRDSNADHDVSKKCKCPTCIPFSVLRLLTRRVCRNMCRDKTTTQILASVCCPCIFIRYFPDLLTFILWTIFYFQSQQVCVSDNKSI